jgi:hypothetical protein
MADRSTFTVAKEMLLAAGLHLDEELGPDCDDPPSSAACVLVGSRDSNLLRIHLYNPGDDFDGIGVSEPDRSLIRVTAEPT